MKPHAPFKTFPAILVLMAGCLSLTSEAISATTEADPTQWTSADGVTIKARLSGWDGSRVFLVRNGHLYEVPLARLSPECVAKAKRLLGVTGSPSTRSNEMSVAARTAAPRNDLGPLPRTETIPNPPVQIPSHVAVPAIVAATTPIDRHGMPIHPYQVRTRIVRTTAYSCGESDHLIYGSLNALGTPLQSGIQLRSAAADWSVYPAGTTFRIKGLPYVYVVDDYGSALAGTGTIDIYQPDMDSMRQWGRRNVEVTIVQWGSLTRSAQILSRRTQSGHCRQMLANIVRQRPGLASLAMR